MKSTHLYIVCLILWHTAGLCLGQSNLLRNADFEGDILNGDFPRSGQHLVDNGPPIWFEFNHNGEVRWYYDSIWTPQNQNQFNPLFQNGYYAPHDFLVAYPWESGSIGDSMVLQSAHGGQYFVGFDAKTDGPSREGVQTFISSCPLNSGTYSASLFWSRAYLTDKEAKIYLSLSDQYDHRSYIFDNFSVIEGSYLAGQWYNYTTSFQLGLTNPDHIGNKWFAITGQQLGNSDPRHYMYFDDVRLYRPCDDFLECVPTHGQICPSLSTPQHPGDLLRVSNISNASDLRLKITSQSGSLVKDTTYHNANGLPDWRFTRLGLPIATGSALYNYDVVVSNACGGWKQTGTIQVFDTAAYNPITPYSDLTANWTGVPIPCCLNSITLQNMQIVGDVSFIVRDQITVQSGVSLAPNSHVTLQAGNVTELSNVDFDGTNSTLEIVEVPCPNRMACGNGNGCGGGSMVMDAGEFVMPVQVAADSQVTVKGNLAPISTSMESKATTPAEARLWAFPNPFAKEFQVGIELPTAADCRLEVLDLQMRPVRVAFQGEQLQAGTHQMSVDLGGLPAGVYLVRLQADGRSLFQRVVKQ